MTSAVDGWQAAPPRVAAPIVAAACVFCRRPQLYRDTSYQRHEE